MDKQLTITELKAELNKICSKYKLRIDEEYQILPQDNTILPEKFPYSVGDFTIKRRKDGFNYYCTDDTGIFYKGKLLKKPELHLLCADYSVMLVNEMSQDETLIKILDADLEISKAIGEKDKDIACSFFSNKVNYFIDSKYDIIKEIKSMLHEVNGFLGLKALQKIDDSIESWEGEIEGNKFYIQQAQQSIKSFQGEIKRIEEEEIKRLKNIKQNYAK